MHTGRITFLGKESTWYLQQYLITKMQKIPTNIKIILKDYVQLFFWWSFSSPYAIGHHQYVSFSSLALFTVYIGLLSVVKIQSPSSQYIHVYMFLCAYIFVCVYMYRCMQTHTSHFCSKKRAVLREHMVLEPGKWKVPCCQGAWSSTFPIVPREVGKGLWERGLDPAQGKILGS